MSNGGLWANLGGVMLLRFILRLDKTIVMSQRGFMANVRDKILENHSPCLSYSTKSLREHGFLKCKLQKKILREQKCGTISKSHWCALQLKAKSCEEYVMCVDAIDPIEIIQHWYCIKTLQTHGLLYINHKSH